MRLLLTTALIAGGAILSGVPKAALAMPITGSVGFSGVFTPIDSGGTPVALGSASGIDFGAAAATSSSGDLASSIGFLTPAIFTDFQFSPMLDPNPVNPLWAAGDFEFRLDGVTVVGQSNTFLTLEGIGVMEHTGGAFDTTPYAWSFSGDGTGGLFTFSNTTSPQSVPEPSETLSIMILGLSVLALCAWSRRRMEKEITQG